MLNNDKNLNENTTNLLTEQGEVVSIEGCFANVQVQTQSGCSGCDSSASCGTSVLGSYFKSGKRGLIKVKNDLNAQVGDQVELSLDQSHLIKQAFMAYGVPLLGLFLFAVLFKKVALNVFGLSEGGGEFFAILGGFFGVFIGWYATHKYHQPVLPKMVRLTKASEKN